MSAKPHHLPHFTAFDSALEAYLHGLPKDKQKSKFIALCRGSIDASPQAINDLIQQEHSKYALSGPVRRLFNRLTAALKDYSEVVDQLVSVKPLPIAIIWGALKVVVESANRCNDMFVFMKHELRSLIDQLQRITDYEVLYANSNPMQELFFRSYTNIVRFWHRVHKECKRGGFDTIRHSLTSSSTNKLSAIVKDFKYDVDCIAAQASIVQAQIDSKEYAEAQNERVKAEEERIKQSTWRTKQSAHNYLELRTRIRDFLTPSHALTANDNCHESNLGLYQDGSCRWLTEHSFYRTWSNSCSKSSHPVFCLSGPAGYGKSILSSYAIRDLQQTHGAAVAYYFSQFSERRDSVSELLRLFALQLFNIYFERHLPVDESLCHKVLCSTSNEQFQELIINLSFELAPVYFMVDGLDEAHLAASQPTLSRVLRFICTQLVDKAYARLWITKRQQARPVDCYEAILDVCSPFVLEMDEHTEDDVVQFLCTKFRALERRFGDLSEDDSALFRFVEKDLTSRAKGHFLWARVMTQSFEGEDRVDNVEDLLRRVRAPQSDSLDDLYQQNFRRIKPENRKIASKIMALIAFSRRQLRIEEVREASVLLITRGKKNAGDGGLSKMSVQILFSRFTALVEIDKGSLPEEEGSCRLVHSSVLEFLINKPGVLGEDRPLQITPYTIADACLLYLHRPVYAQPLRRQTTASDVSEWLDCMGCSMDDHHFAQYAAKYWSRHLEDIKPTDALRNRVTAFVESPNFQTCTQIQSIWVQGKFDVYYLFGCKAGVFGVLPDWFIRGPPTRGKRAAVAQHWSDYQMLLHDWQYLLSCGGCHDNVPDCPVLAHRGELDRIWWSTLGPKHLFSGSKSRYTSFSLADPESPAASCGRFVCERWNFERPYDAPTLIKKHTIRTDESSTNWHLYSSDRLRPSWSSRRIVGRGETVRIYGQCEYLRIGAQIFALDNGDEYRPLVFSGSGREGDGAPRYFEDIDARGAFVAFSTRAHTAAQELLNPFLVEDRIGQDIMRMERWAKKPVGEEEEEDSEPEDDVSESEDSEESDGGWSSDGDGSDAGHGYESWSQGSTDDEDAIDSDCLDDDSEDEWAMDSESDTEESEAELSDSGKDKNVNCEDNDADSDDENFVPPASFLPNRVLDDATGRVIDIDLGPDIPQDGLPVFRKHSHDKTPIMQLVIFDTSGQTPRKVFQYRQPMSFALHVSSPAIHPTMPLVVWPLGAGDMLFADFVQKTFFTKTMRPSAPHAQNITVSVHFHSNGQLMHVACLEVQLEEAPRKGKTTKHKLSLSLLVSTYRLSSRKTTRSPPSLLRRIKANLGRHNKLTASEIFISTFNWTNNELFVVPSAPELIVFRIPLLLPSTSSPRQNAHVLVPINRIFLPQTARLRCVHFIPHPDGDIDDGKTPIRIIIGSEHTPDSNTDTKPDEVLLRKALLPPIGCILRQEDIGGWVKAKDVQIPKGQRVGKLDRRKEKFDPVNDFLRQFLQRSHHNRIPIV